MMPFGVVLTMVRNTLTSCNRGVFTYMVGCRMGESSCQLVHKDASRDDSESVVHVAFPMVELT